jgi:phosphoglycerol transferase MdoB-like AlkP superfamily enzyme
MLSGPFKQRYSVAGPLLCLYLLLGVVTRCVLLFATPSAHIGASQIPGIFGIGLVFDLAIGGLVLIPLLLQLWFENEWMYTGHKKWWIAGAAVLLFGMAVYFNWLPKEFNGSIYEVLVIYVWLRIAIFILLAAAGKEFRQTWRKWILFFITGLTVFLMLFNTVSEYFFWQEFSARYNFIAVDYLVYTHEVVGNISESYPVLWIITGCLLTSVVISYLFRKQVIRSATDNQRFLPRTLYLILLIAVPAILAGVLKNSTRSFSKNEYANEMAGNGIFQFAYAFRHNELDYEKYYLTESKMQVFTTLMQLLSPGTSVKQDQISTARNISPVGPENRYNIVLITVESLSASFMKAFGNDQNITPYLDSLAPHSWFFKNLYGSGTRTVRGLEALSLGIPPTPGQSIVKRPDNGELFSLGNLLKSKGYITQFLYGGYSYFDNMKDFFSHNGYDVIDRNAIPEDEVHYQNIWGVADEDLFTLALKTFDNNTKLGKPFFSQIMTVSNHRPYTYPDGRIDIPSKTHSREGAVKYTDFAIGNFIKRAQSHNWFDNTIFVVVADHCAGSAGTVELPVSGYHIPMLIYAPKFIQPKAEEKLTAQIDLPPTLMGLLNIPYESKFFGEDIRKADSMNRRIFISTYQGLGYFTRDTLAILSPVRKIKYFLPDFKTGDAKETPENPRIRQEAISFYEGAALAYKSGQQKFKK